MIIRMVVFYLLTAIFVIILGGAQQEVLPDATFLAQWGPGVAGLVTMLIFRKKDGVRITFFEADMPAGRYLWALLLPLGFGLLPYIFSLLVLGDPQSMRITPSILLMMLVGAVGEEIGWRGYLHQRIAPHLNGWVSSLIVGVLWTLFHVHYWQGGVLFVAFIGLALTAMSLMMYVLLAEYAFNVLGATIFHLGINLASALSAGLIFKYNLTFAIVFGLSAVLVAAVVVFLRRDHLPDKATTPA